MHLKFVVAISNGVNVTQETLSHAEIRERFSRIAQGVKELQMGRDIRVGVLTSVDKTSYQGATIVAKELGVEPLVCMQLQVDDLDYHSDTRMKRKTLGRFAERHGLDAIVTVSGPATPCGIIHSFARKYFEKEVGQTTLAGGEAICIDQFGEVQYLPN